jgi:hypothetical protein
LLSYGRFGYVEMTKILMIKILLTCRLFTALQICSVLWSQLQRLEDRALFTEVSTRLENRVKDFIFQHGWLHNRLIPVDMLVFLFSVMTTLLVLFDTRTVLCILVTQRLGIMLKTFV